jgi:PIN domain nuclease of toxin-antitoxin system
MDYLLDTHVLLWVVSEPDKVSGKHRKIIEDSNNRIFVSYLSYMEISIKVKIGKLPDFKTDINTLVAHVESRGMVNLNIEVPHIQHYQNLPLIDDHRDPFDRFIISTAIAENMKILSVDKKFQLYKKYLKVV